jgi:hypothetical protein
MPAETNESAQTAGQQTARALAAARAAQAPLATAAKVEGPKAVATSGAADPAANSIQKARAERDHAAGYDALVEEVEELEASEATGTVREGIVRLRNKIEMPPLKEGFSNDANSAVARKANVDAVRAVAQALAEEV